MSRSLTAKRLGAGLAGAAAALALGIGGAGVADAKIQPVDTQCTNNGGQQPNGQQPSCTGGGLTQESENQNPAGHAPPGQN
ncbi:hypothetical protein [Streptomyces sp. PAN_FS17]|uniref:hypothetical protein n=1 Tax=Streptomyces sp. PAN_FS17 TaxID=1855351 RepID=UPI00089CACB3|nr:hypothetical protein [Streptomyces sp. PAN_FS17]SEC48921.1 hypothetical protein SAMN05216482_3498 [Streptomyces sp. PAN_FS17]